MTMAGCPGTVAQRPLAGPTLSDAVHPALLERASSSSTPLPLPASPRQGRGASDTLLWGGARTFGNAVAVAISDPREVLPRVAKVRAAGARWIRTDFLWHRTELEVDSFNFSGYAAIADSCATHGIGLIFVLRHGHPLYTKAALDPPTTEKSIQAFARWAGKAAAAFRGHDVVWEIWNEPNYKVFWYPRPDPAAFHKLLRTTLDSIRNAAPQARVIAPGLLNLDLAFLKAVTDDTVRRKLDAISIHPYRHRKHPESLLEEWDNVRSLWDGAIVISEWGYTSTGDLAVSPRTQADYVSRLLLVGAMVGSPIISIYAWKDPGIDSTDSENGFGFFKDWQAGGGERPSFGIFKWILDQIGGYEMEAILQHPSGSLSEIPWLASFRKGNRVKFCVWTSHGAMESPKLPLSDGSYVVSRHGTAEFEIRIRDGIVPIRIDGTPTILWRK